MFLTRGKTLYMPCSTSKPRFPVHLFAMFHHQHRSWIQAGTHQEKTPETSAVSPAFTCGKHLAMLDFDSHLLGG